MNKFSTSKTQLFSWRQTYLICENWVFKKEREPMSSTYKIDI